jgi:hypothetical protein
MDERQQTILEKVDKLEVHVGKQNNRLSKLENWRWYLGGGITVAWLALKFWG